MKKRRKHKACLNCGELLHQKHNFCPKCGQENTDNQVSIGLLIKEFVSNFFSLDSRFGRTIYPFLFQPGKITKAFIEGRRVFYANPIRWYLVISIFHFFFMSKMFAPTAKDKKLSGFMGDVEVLTPEKFDSLYHLPDSLHSPGWVSDEKMLLIRHLNETTNLSPEEIMDSLKMNDYDWKRRLAALKVIKISQESRASLNTYLMSKIPIIIFCLLPVFAFLLKLFFWKKGLYINHLIHSIHLHSFFFFLLGWVWLFSLLVEDFEDYGLPVSFVLFAIYSIFSFRNVYKVKIGWCVLRFLLIGGIYSFLVVLSLIFGIFISLAFI